MTTKIKETEYSLEINLIPESMSDLALLLRFANNSKRDKPDIFLSFSNEPYCNISLAKVKKQNQINSISK